MSAIERTHTNLASLNPNFSLLFIELFFCEPYVGRRCREYIFDFVSFLYFTHDSLCKLVIFYVFLLN
jgi:hypothetical protein